MICLHPFWLHIRTLSRSGWFASRSVCVFFARESSLGALPRNRKELSQIGTINFLINKICLPHFANSEAIKMMRNLPQNEPIFHRLQTPIPFNLLVLFVGWRALLTQAIDRNVDIFNSSLLVCVRARARERELSLSKRMS